MSFILDALKKSENDRQRQIGPALFEMRVARPRSQYPTWAIVLLALLVVNLAVIGWLMFRRPAAAAIPQQTQASTAESAAARPPAMGQQSAAAPPVVQAAPVAQMAAPVIYAPVPMTPPTAASPYPQSAVSQYQQSAALPYQQRASSPYQQAAVEPYQRAPAPPYQQAPFTAPATVSQGYAGTPPPQQGPPQRERLANAEEANPDDYAPATEPNGGDRPFGHVRRGLANGLMTYQEAAAKHSIPPLHMDLHVYAPDPRKRFVLINSKRLLEGESLPEGVRVDSITSDGVILSCRGVQFMLERE